MGESGKRSGAGAVLGARAGGQGPPRSAREGARVSKCAQGPAGDRGAGDRSAGDRGAGVQPASWGPRGARGRSGKEEAPSPREGASV